MVAILIIGVLLILGGGGAALYIFVIAPKPKQKVYKTVRTEQKQAVNATTVMKSKVDEKLLINWLEQADESYIDAFQFKKLGNFIKYAHPSLCAKVQQAVNYKNTRLWGTKKYRIRKWEVVSVSEEAVLVRKELNFKKIKFGYAEVPMGDRCVEYWKVETLARNQFRVVSIQDSI